MAELEKLSFVNPEMLKANAYPSWRYQVLADEARSGASVEVARDNPHN